MSLHRDAAAYHQFLAASRRYWSGPMFRALQSEIAAEPALADDPGTLAARLEQHPTHRLFAWFERHLQRLKYSGRWGLVPVLAAERDALEASLHAALPDGLLTLDHALTPPGYYQDTDVHQHPGGLGGDILAGIVYRTASGQGGVVGKPMLHERFAAAVANAVATPPPERILDLGCGFGKSARAFAAAFADADVTGVDLSAACLRLAAADAPPEWHNRLRYRQADAAATGLPTGGYHLVTSTMLLHEMPTEALRALFLETARLLAPGGCAIHLDFLPPEDPFLRVLYDGHSRRNNEPFMRDLAALDLPAEMSRAGFTNVEITRFAEEEGALDEPARKWRLPWTMIVARKPEDSAR